MKRLIKDNPGALATVMFVAVYYSTAGILSILIGMNNSARYFVDGAERLILGVLELNIFIKAFHKEERVIGYRGFKAAVFASLAIFLMIMYCAVFEFLEIKAYVKTTVDFAFAYVFFEQFATAYWEEITFRLFLTEGYYTHGEHTAKRRFGYTLFSSILFGLPHIIGTQSLSEGANAFLGAAAMGFAFTAVYLYSHNILLPMIMHFLYNVIAVSRGFAEEYNENQSLIIIDNYLYWVIIGVMLLWAVFILIKGEKDDCY